MMFGKRIAYNPADIKGIHEIIQREYYEPTVRMLEDQYKDHIDENKRLKEEVKLLQAKLEGVELAKQLFVEGFKVGKDA